LGVGLVFVLDEATTSLLHALPNASAPRYAQGRGASIAQPLGFQGALVPPVDVPEWGPE
jgi:hypothetical protein